MKSEYKLLAALVGFAVLLGGAVLLYNSLNERYAPQVELQPKSGAQPAAETPVQDSGESAQESAQEAEPDLFPAPDFMVLDSEGNEVMLSDLFGMPIVLNFWASWCPPCKQEMPEFQEVFEQWGDEVRFVMVDLVGGQETMALGAAYIEEQGYTFPVYYDVNQEAAYGYGISSIPTSIFIDGDGNIVTGAVGAISKDTLLQAIDLLTGE